MKQIYDFCYIISDVLFISIATLTAIKLIIEIYAIRIITKCTNEELASLMLMQFETPNTKIMLEIGKAKYAFEKIIKYSTYAFMLFYSIKIIVQ